jgi:hypothetical protein
MDGSWDSSEWIKTKEMQAAALNEDKSCEAVKDLRLFLLSSSLPRCVHMK